MTTPPVERIEHSNDHVTFIHKDIYIPGEGDTADHRLVWFSSSTPLFRRKWVMLKTLDAEGNVIGEHFVSSHCTDEESLYELLHEIMHNGFDKYKYITYSPDAPETIKISSSNVFHEQEVTKRGN